MIDAVKGLYFLLPNLILEQESLTSPLISASMVFQFDISANKRAIFCRPKLPQHHSELSVALHIEENRIKTENTFEAECKVKLRLIVR